MPFPQQTPQVYARPIIEALKENQTGVYGIYKQNSWIYIGKGDIRSRLLAHLNGDNPCISREAPTHFVSEVTSGDPSEREKQLILELNPKCNQRLG